MNRGELIAGVVLALLGGYVVSEAVRWEYSGPDGPGPGFFPLWYGLAMTALALVLIVQSVVAEAEAAERKLLRWPQVRRVLAVWGGFVVCVASLRWLGFVAGFGLFVLFMVAVMYRRPWHVAATVAAGCAAGFYLVFALALDVRLPTGALGF